MELQEFMKIVIKKLDEHTQILNRHEEKLNRVEEKLDRHEEKLDRHEIILKNHEEILNELKRATLNIEDYVTNRIPALFDAYSASKEKSDKLEEKVQKLEKTTSLHSIKISILKEANKQK